MKNCPTAANSTRLLAKNLMLNDESKGVFALLHQQYIDRINPTDAIEITPIAELAATVWRQRRLLAFETNLFNPAAANAQRRLLSAASPARSPISPVAPNST
jgi:hypothetical protein